MWRTPQVVRTFDHGEVGTDRIGSLEVKADGQFAGILCGEDVVDRFDERELVCMFAQPYALSLRGHRTRFRCRANRGASVREIYV